MKADESHFFSTLVPAILCMILSCSKFATGLQQQKQIAAKSLDVRLEDYRDESNIPKSRKKRSVIFPTGSDLSFDVGLSIPISALSATSTTFDIGVPFTYNLPNSTASLVYTGRKMEDEHSAVFEMAEDLLNKFGIDGKACVLRLICELAESKGLPYNGLMGRAIETLFLIDYGMSNTDRLYEYISARMYGEHTGDCLTAYPQCPFSAFQLLDPEELLQTISNNII